MVEIFVVVVVVVGVVALRGQAQCARLGSGTVVSITLVAPLG